jgi:hypothetical protein
MPSNTCKQQRAYTIEAVERSGKWVLGSRNPWKIPVAMLYAWRDQGCPYRKGRRITCKVVLVKGDGGGWNGPRLAYFFLRRELEQIAPLYHAPGDGAYSLRGKTGGSSRMLKARYRDREVIVRHGRRLLASRAAQRFLGVNQSVLSKWTRTRCPFHPDGKRLNFVWGDEAGGKTRYYFEDELHQVKEAKDRLPREAPGPEEIDLAETAKRLNVSPLALRYRQTRSALGLRAILRPARGNDGRPHRRLVFRAADVDALARAAARPAEQAPPKHDPFNGRLRLDHATRTVWLDGTNYTVHHAAAYNVLRHVAERAGQFVPTTDIKAHVAGCSGRLDKLLADHLPAELRRILVGQSGPSGGYAVVLPRPK